MYWLCSLRAGAVTRALASGLIATLVAVACTPAPSGTSSATPAATQSQSAQSAVLRVAYSAGPGSLDAHRLGGPQGGETHAELSAFFDSYTILGPDGTVRPHLITEWKTNNESTVWTLKVRQGVTCHDGEVFDAQDVVYSLKRARDHPASVVGTSTYINGYLPKGANNVVALDALTVQITSPVPYILIPGDLAWMYAICKDYAERVGDDVLLRQPVGTGPFKFVDHRVNEFISAERFEKYWGGAPDFKELQMRFIPTAAGRVAALLAGEIDYVSGMSFDDARRIDSSPNARSALVPSNFSIFVMFDYQRPQLVGKGTKNPMLDVRVRRAIYHAIDIDTLTKNVMRGSAEVTTQYWLPFVRGYDPGIRRLAYDPDRAKQLVAEAGYPNGFDLTLDGPTGVHPNDATVTEAIASMLSKVGIRTTPNVMPGNLFTEYLVAGKSHLALRNGGMGNLDLFGTADAFFFCGGRVNFMQSCVPEVDALVKTANGTVDLSKREALMKEANRLYHVEHVVTVPLYMFMNPSGVAKGVRWTPGWAGYMHRPRDFGRAQ